MGPLGTNGGFLRGENTPFLGGLKKLRVFEQWKKEAKYAGGRNKYI